jgi:HK97 family phage prohead protease
MPPSRVFQRHAAPVSPEAELRFTEVRATSTPSGNKIEGYAAVFNTRAQLPGFQEVIKPGAFSRAISQADDVVCLFNHNADLPLGRTTPGTLRLDEDSRGLHYVCDLPNTSYGRDAYESIKRGDIAGCSFGFIVDPDGQSWSNDTDENGNQYILRSITSVKLLDVSPVTYPCYKGTAVQARAVQPPAEPRSLLLRNGFKMPTVEECLAITHRAQDRKRQERDAADQVTRRKKFLRDFLLS